jgi:probable phosphomutase (TIGR03848 family)
MPVVLLIRHGENDVMHRSLAGRLPGVHLNEPGRGQAAALIERLKNLPVNVIYSSPLERALETAEPLAGTRGLPVQVIPGLIEIDYGQLQGKTYKQLQRINVWKMLQEEPSRVQFPGGESLPGALRRVTAALDQIIESHAKNEVIVCFTHADVVRLAVAYYLHMLLNDFQRLSVAPASITGLLLGEGTPQLLFMNLTSGVLPGMEK